MMEAWASKVLAFLGKARNGASMVQIKKAVLGG
jgi:hypothetical protein